MSRKWNAGKKYALEEPGKGDGTEGGKVKSLPAASAHPRTQRAHQVRKRHCEYHKQDLDPDRPAPCQQISAAQQGRTSHQRAKKPQHSQKQYSKCQASLHPDPQRKMRFSIGLFSLRCFEFRSVIENAQPKHREEYGKAP